MMPKLVSAGRALLLSLIVCAVVWAGVGYVVWLVVA